MARDYNPYYRFTVESRYPFPVDMLRYDSCFPSDSETANRIAASLGDQPNERQSYTLEGRMRFGPTVERWESFMFKVVEVEEFN